jgi:hypothetical protein
MTEILRCKLTAACSRFDEMSTTLLPVGSWLPTAAMELADRKSLGSKSLHS